MKTIYLVRHAKSSWADPGQKDHERPLLKVGIDRTQKVADFLIKKKVKPGLIISSHAVRAFQTARLLAKALGFPEEDIRQERQIYLGTEDSLLDLVHALPDELESVMLVGHNPVMTGLAQMLQARITEDLSTSAVVSVSFETDTWQSLLLASKQVNFVVYPRML
ncbi:MAG: histidine phosphatase family protein [Bacteroidales bacterium]|nr:histidine phosphatase family protein [Bacteroidales bacterium]